MPIESVLSPILETVLDAVVVMDRDGVVRAWNGHAQAIFGWSASEAIGQNLGELIVPPGLRQAHHRGLKRFNAKGVAKVLDQRLELTGLHRDGSEVPVELSITLVSRDGRDVFVGFLRDISERTERRQTELRLQDLQSELAHVRRLSEMSTLATSLAHEINQPLTAIANYSEAARIMLEKLPPGDETRKLSDILEATAAQVLRVGEIVRRLRDFISHGHTAYGPESLPRLITEANTLALVGTRELAIEVEIDMDSEANQVLADRIQIQQVLVNLIRNGIDAMMESARRNIAISTRREGEFVRVSVQDTGTGLDETVAENLFQPFISSKPTGMGVGLSISRMIVEAHGGKIWFEPVPNGGSVFHFTLPAVA